MTEEIRQPFPTAYLAIDAATKASGFTMASDVLTCGLLRTLASAKPSGRFLELGTGTGLSTSWIADGMDEVSTLVSNLLNFHTFLFNSFTNNVFNVHSH